MLQKLLIFSVLLMLGCATSTKQKFFADKETEMLAQISDEFKNPPMSVKPGAFWCWLNGNMSPTSITRDLEAMKSKGINRAEIWDVAAVKNPSFIPAGGEFLGDESVSLIKHAISEGKRLKMKIGIVASSGWNAGGSWVTPDWASKNLYCSKIDVTGPRELSIDLPFPKFPEGCPMKNRDTPVFYKDVSVLAVPYSADLKIDDVSRVVTLTPFFKNGKLLWKVPEGKWTILRFVCSNNGQQLIVPSPNSNGLFIDFFDPQATKKHLKHFMDRLGVTPENSSEAGLAYFEFDSMELAEGTPWTDSFPAIFREKHQYEIEKYLPVLAGWDIRNSTERFRYDFNQTVSDQLIYSHYQTGTEFLKTYNAELVSESGGPGAPVWNTCPVDALKALGNVSVPRGEFWIKHRNMFLIKEISSASHIYGKKIVDAESFTTWRRWKGGPFHSQNAEAAFFHTPGLKIVYPSTAEDAKGLMKSAIRDDDCVLYFEHKYLYRRIKGVMPQGDHLVPIGKARVAREGTDVSIITYAATVWKALEAAEQVAAEDGISVEVIDLRTLAPLDDEAIVKTVRKTNRVLIVHEDTRTGGIAGEITARINETCFEWLDAPVLRITALDVPLPSAPTLEDYVLPQTADIVHGIRRLARY